MVESPAIASERRLLEERAWNKTKVVSLRIPVLVYEDLKKLESSSRTSFPVLLRDVLSRGIRDFKLNHSIASSPVVGSNGSMIKLQSTEAIERAKKGEMLEEKFMRILLFGDVDLKEAKLRRSKVGWNST